MCNVPVHTKLDTACTKGKYGTYPDIYDKNWFCGSHRKPCWPPPPPSHVTRCNTGLANEVACIGKQQQHRCGRAGTGCKHYTHTHIEASVPAVHSCRTIPTLLLVCLCFGVFLHGIKGTNCNFLTLQHTIMSCCIYASKVNSVSLYALSRGKGTVASLIRSSLFVVMNVNPGFSLHRII
jgi:hypothetical protein